MPCVPFRASCGTLVTVTDPALARAHDHELNCRVAAIGRDITRHASRGRTATRERCIISRAGEAPVRYIRYADRVLPPRKREQAIHTSFCRRLPATCTTSNLTVYGEIS